VAWAREQEGDKGAAKTVAFYKIEVYNCQRIHYDPNFMVETEPKIRDSFALFQKYKDDPDKIDVDYPESAKKTRNSDRGPKLAPFAFVGLGNLEPAAPGAPSANPPPRTCAPAKPRFANTKLKSFAFV
jgi:hypothetical protein